MSVTPIVSIIIVNYNAGDYLKRCLQTVWEQTFDEYEVIIVDNASSDDSLATVADDDRLAIIYNDQNLGFATAQNQGMHLARGRYIMPLNFDVVLTATFLQEMVVAMEQLEQVGTVSGKLLQMRPDGQPTNKIYSAGMLLPRNRSSILRGFNEIDQGQYDQPMFVFGALGAAPLYRREMLEDTKYQGQYFDESYFMWYEESDLDWRARLGGWECLYVPWAVAYHVGDVHGVNRSRFGFKISMRNRWRMILSNECPRCLFRYAPWLIAKEILTLKRGVGGMRRRHFWIVYLQALSSFIAFLPVTLKKRCWIRGRVRQTCLPTYPISITGELSRVKNTTEYENIA